MGWTCDYLVEQPQAGPQSALVKEGAGSYIWNCCVQALEAWRNTGAGHTMSRLHGCVLAVGSIYEQNEALIFYNMYVSELRM